MYKMRAMCFTCLSSSLIPSKGDCGEGGVGRRNALMGERVLRRAVKRRASEWWLTPVSNSSDCRRDKRKGLRSPGRGERAFTSTSTSAVCSGDCHTDSRKPPTGSFMILMFYLFVGRNNKDPLARHPWLPRLPSLQPWTLLQWFLARLSCNMSQIFIINLHWLPRAARIKFKALIIIIICYINNVF